MLETKTIVVRYTVAPMLELVEMPRSNRFLGDIKGRAPQDILPGSESEEEPQLTWNERLIVGFG
jgi:hypothetical protein